MNAYDEIKALRDQMNDAAAAIHPYSVPTTAESNELRKKQEYFFGASAALTGILCATLNDPTALTVEWQHVVSMISFTNEFMLKE